MKAMKRLGAAMFAAGFAATAHAAPWVEMTAGGAEIRLVTAAPDCPRAVIDGEAVVLTDRAGPTERFPNRVCSTPVPAGARRATVAGVRVVLPKARPRRIVVIGDTGCRLKGLVNQHCNDPSGWPFARVARLAAAARPDLVIHVGDYYYRETPCPSGDAACAGSPYGDRWATWKAEVFDPAAPLLAAAPWVFARGNHEDCKRGGAGWFRLLDAAATVKACPAQSDTFTVELGGLRLYVVDSADTDDLGAPDALVDAFAARLKGVGSCRRRTVVDRHPSAGVECPAPGKPARRRPAERHGARGGEALRSDRDRHGALRPRAQFRGSLVRRRRAPPSSSSAPAATRSTSTPPRRPPPGTPRWTASPPPPFPWAAGATSSSTARPAAGAARSTTSRTGWWRRAG